MKKNKDDIFTPEMNAVCAAYEQCNDIRAAALRADVSPAQVADWIEDIPAFRYKIDLIKSRKDADLTWEGGEGLNQKQRSYLVAFSQSGRVGHSARIAGVTYQAVHQWRKGSEAFRIAEESAREMATQALEDEATRRAGEGGSDRLMEFMLKALKPGMYANLGTEGQAQFIKIVGLESETAKKLAAEVAEINSKEQK